MAICDAGSGCTNKCTGGCGCIYDGKKCYCYCEGEPELPENPQPLEYMTEVNISVSHLPLVDLSVFADAIATDAIFVPANRAYNCVSFEAEGMAFGESLEQVGLEYRESK